MCGRRGGVLDVRETLHGHMPDQRAFARPGGAQAEPMFPDHELPRQGMLFFCHACCWRDFVYL